MFSDPEVGATMCHFEILFLHDDNYEVFLQKAVYRSVLSVSDYMLSLPMSNEGFLILTVLLCLGSFCSISTQWSFVLFYVCVFAIQLMYFYKIIIIKSVHIAKCKSCQAECMLCFLEHAFSFLCLSFLCLQTAVLSSL